MSDIRVTYDGDTYWLECIPGNANSILIMPVEPGDSWEQLAQEVADHQAQHGCAPEPEPAEQAAPCDPEPKRYALVEQMGHRATVGTVREVMFCGVPMIEVTDLRTGSVHLVSPQSVYEITWLTGDEARQRTRPWTAQAITAGDPWKPGPDPWGVTESDPGGDEDGQHARGIAAEDGDPGDCEPAL